MNCPRFLASSALLLLCACAGTSQDVRPDSPSITEDQLGTQIAQYNEKVAEDEQLVCRAERRTGTHRTTHVCRTKGEIAERAKEDRAIVEGRTNRVDGILSGN